AARLNAASPSPVPLVRADARALPFADDVFDLAFTAFGALPFVRDVGAVHREVARVLRPGGRFVFSVNVPGPKWWKVGLLSAGDIFRTGRPLRFLKRGWRMMKYGRWLKQEARAGRFHYLPADAVAA
ncbi:MAG TPA: class I SAM-dependent methyltransferase, partial [Actinotalea sp.]|nr:class I SAM-dependent methyltransferase [Actinotalea sp.]